MPRKILYRELVLDEHGFYTTGNFNQDGEWVDDPSGTEIKTRTVPGLFEYFGIDVVPAGNNYMQQTIAIIQDKNGFLIKVTDMSAIQFVQ